MNPEVRTNPLLVRYFANEVQIVPEAPKNGPLGTHFAEHRKGIIKRSTWLLDFTDKHPLFYGQSSPDKEVPQAKDVFSGRLGKAHLEQWRALGEAAVKESAAAMAIYGYWLTKDIINGLRFNDIHDANHYEEIDSIQPFEGYLVKNSLQEYAKDPLFRRMLNLIKFSAQHQDALNENERLAIFSTLVGFAQSYTDTVAKEQVLKKGQKGNKHVMRDQVLLYALYQYDHGLRHYLEALNNGVPQKENEEIIM